MSFVVMAVSQASDVWAMAGNMYIVMLLALSQGTHGHSCLSWLSHCGPILAHNLELACMT